MDDYLTQYVSRLMMHDLNAETDERQALRKALLTLILAVQDGAPERVRELIDYLVMGFKPLAGGFRDHTHPFRGQHSLTRARAPEAEHVFLMVPQGMIDEIVNGG